MTRTLGNESDFVPRGILYRNAKAMGYDGTQEELLQRADELAKEDIIESASIGRSQFTAYKHKEEVA
jgi:hypothetical protein